MTPKYRHLVIVEIDLISYPKILAEIDLVRRVNKR
tara:strand:+ start:399 stop:503 length:105 start_codon:yes stop_codon:yes gene_type:complete